MAVDEETLKRRYREFLDLMPLTISIAGLASNQNMLNFTSDQMEGRAQTLATAFKVARQMVRETLSASS